MPVENVPTFVQVRTIAKEGDFPVPQTTAFGVVSEATANPLFVPCEAELLCLGGKDNLTTSSALPDRSPHAAIYASDLHCMVKHLLYRFMKTDAVDDTSLASLPELNLVDSSFMRKSSDIDIGFTADTHLKLMQRSTKSKVSDRDAMGLRPFHARLSLVS